MDGISKQSNKGKTDSLSKRKLKKNLLKNFTFL